MTSASPLQILSTPWLPDDKGGLGGEFRADWLQGRAVFGGMVSGVLAAAMQQHAADRPARSLSVQFCAPTRPGPARAHVDPVREGRYLTQVASHLEQEGRVVARAFASFGGAREYPIHHISDRVPEVVPPEQVPEIQHSSALPAFTQHVDFRFALGAPPMSRASVPEVGGWCRFRTPMPPDLVMFCGLLDVWPPPAFSMLGQARPGATVDLTHHFLAPLPLRDVAEDAHYLFSCRAPTATDGYQEMAGELWTAQGRLLARTRQMVALF